jgi:NAD(P)-dependent dehydrogenase (short-subunit alcohol dehydrogenase family)
MPKTIVVTGIATGIGRATVNKFEAEGWNVVATVRKESDLKTHSDHGRVKTLLLDVDDEPAAANSALSSEPSCRGSMPPGRRGENRRNGLPISSASSLELRVWCVRLALACAVRAGCGNSPPVCGTPCGGGTRPFWG